MTGLQVFGIKAVVVSDWVVIIILYGLTALVLFGGSR
jgi:hypothetical protein